MPGQQVGDYIFQKVREAIGQALLDQRDMIDGWSKDAAENVGTSQIDAMSLGGDGIAGFLGGILGDIPIIGEPIKLLSDLLGNAGGMVEGVTLGWALGTAIYPALRALLLPIIHEVNALTTNEVFDPQTAAELVARQLMEPGHGADEAGGSGFDGDHFDHLVALATTHADVSTLMELFRREVVDQAYVLTTLNRLGYDDDAAKRLITLERNLLSPADLALAVLRGVIDQETMLAYARQVGITDADMNVLIENTGEPLGLEEMLEAYRRKFIDKPTLERGIRQSRVRNEWIPTAEALRYAPMSTADAVRAVVENYITSAEGQEIAEQNGLMPQHWQTLVSSWGRPLAHEEMGSLVHRGLASRTQFDQAMRESDIKDKYIPGAFETTERLLPERLIVSAIHYQAIDLQTGARMLLQLGYSKQSAGVLLKLGLHEAAVKPHELTQAQVVGLYEAGTIHKDQAIRYLASIGYNEQNATYLLQLADARTHIKEVTAEERTTRLSYLAGGYSAEQAKAALEHIGVTGAQADGMIATWNREKHRASRTLSESQIVKAGKEDTITYDEALSLLEAMGYSRPNAIVLLHSNGVVAK